MPNDLSPGVNKYTDIVDSVYENLISEAIGEGGFKKLNKRKKYWPIINNLAYRQVAHYKKNNVHADQLNSNRHSHIVYNDSNRYNHNIVNNFNLDSNDDEDNQLSSDSDEGVFYYKKDLFADQIYLMVSKVLHKNPRLEYYQGFHDVASVLLLVLGPNRAAALLERLALTKLKDFMSTDINKTYKYLELTLTLVQVHDYQLFKFLQKTDTGNIFCLSWIITWFSHNVTSFTNVCRLFDFFMSTHRLMPVYLSASIVMGLREEILMLEPDMATIHSYLTMVPSYLDSEQWEIAIQSATTLFESFDSQSLLAYNSARSTYRTYINLSRYFSRKRHPPGFKKSLLKNHYKKQSAIVNNSQSYYYKLFKLSIPVTILAFASISIVCKYFPISN